MAAREHLICASTELAERGRGVRFTAERAGLPVPAFAVRYSGRVHAYLNRCAHVSVELDWQEGEFFDVSGLYLVCSTHGATYYPETGGCAGGPCAGAGLQRLPTVERDGCVYWIGFEES